MSFHGGAIGVIVALRWFAPKHHRQLSPVSDLLVPFVPIGSGSVG